MFYHVVLVTFTSRLWPHYPYNGTIIFYHVLTFFAGNILIKFLIKFLIKLLTSAQVAISIYDISLVYVSSADILCKAMYAHALVA